MTADRNSEPNKLDRRGVARGGAGPLLVAAVTFAFQLPFFDRWFSVMDEGHMLQFSDIVANGGLLYRDATSYPLPGSFYLLALAFRDEETEGPDSPALDLVTHEGVDGHQVVLDQGRIVDVDGDGFGRNQTILSSDGDCNDTGESTDRGDCNDNDTTVYPGAPEIANDSVDHRLHGITTAAVVVAGHLDPQSLREGRGRGRFDRRTHQGFRRGRTDDGHVA